MFGGIVTTLGIAKITAAVLAGTQVTFQEMAVGDDDTAFDGTETELGNEVDRVGVNFVDIVPDQPDTIVIEAILPVTTGGYWIREFGIYDDEGDMIVCGLYPPSYKPTESEGATSARVMRIWLVIRRTENITLVTDLTTVISTRDYVDAHINRRDNPHEVTTAQLIPGGLVNQALFKASNDDGDTEWRDITAVAVIVDTVEETVTLVDGQTVVGLGVLRTTGLAVYVGGARLISGVDYTITGEDEIELARTYPEGTVVLMANNDPYGHVAATLSSLGLVQLAPKSAAYKLEDAAGPPRVLTGSALGSMLPSLWRDRVFKLANPHACAFAPMFGGGGQVVVAQDFWVGVGLTSAAHWVRKFQAGDVVTIVGLGVPKGSWTIWYDPEDDRLEAYQIAWSAIEAGTRPATNAYGPLGGFEVGDAASSDTDFLPYSFWDTTFRPAARDPRGMVLVGGRFWADIYLHHQQGWNTALASSAYNLPIADGANPPTRFGEIDPVSPYSGCTWHVAVEALAAYGKRVPTYEEFYSLALGAANGVVTPKPTTTGHTSGRRSKWGVEQATGCVPVWGGHGLHINTTPPLTAYTAGQGGKVYSSQPAIYPAFGGSSDLLGTEGGPGHMETLQVSANFVGIRGVCEHLNGR